MRVAWLVALAGWWWTGQHSLLCQTKVDLGRQGKNVDFSAAERVKLYPTGSQLPARCETGESFFLTVAGQGQQLHLCTSRDTWTPAGKELPGAGVGPGRVLKAGESGPEWVAVGGDATGSPEAIRVRGLQGRGVSASVPSDGDVLIYNAAAGLWAPGVPAGAYQPGDGVVLAGNVIGVDGATVPRYAVGAGTPAGACETGRDYYVDTGTGDLYYCGGTNSWTRLVRGEHSHRWGTLTGNLSDQADLYSALAGKAEQVHTHQLSGDLSGSTTGATVVRIQGRPVSSSPPTDGAVLAWSASAQQWEPLVPGQQGGGFNPLDATVVWLRDDFCGHGTGGQQIGSIGWWSYAVGTVTSMSLSFGNADAPCVFRDLGISSTNPNDYRTIILSNPGGILFSGGRTVPWRAVFRFTIASGLAVARARFGFGPYDYGLVPSVFIGIRLDKDANWDGDAASTWVACVCNGTAKSNCTDIDTQVQVSEWTWYKLEIWSETAGVINMRLNGGETITFNNPSTIPGTNVVLQPHWILGRTGGTGAVRAELDFFGFMRAGLSR